MKLRFCLIVSICLVLLYPCAVDSQTTNNDSCAAESLLNYIRITTGEISISTESTNQVITALPDGKRSMLDIKETAKKLGYSLVGVKCNINELKELSTPSIVHIKNDQLEHFAVVEWISDKYIRIINGDFELGLLTIDEFANTFSGIALVPAYSIETNAQKQRIWADTHVVDVGNIMRGSVINKAVKLYTDSPTDISIINTNMCCGLTTDLHGGATFKANAPVTFNLTFNSSTYLGRFKRDFYIITNSKYHPIITISLIGNTPLGAIAVPQSLNYGNCINNSMVAQKFVLYGISSEQAESLSIQLPSAMFSIISKEYNETDSTETIVISVKPNTTAGMIRTELVVKYTSETGDTSLILPIWINVCDAIVALPPIFQFGFLKVGEEKTERVKLTSKIGEFSVLDIKHPDVISVKVVEDNNNCYIDATISRDAKINIIDEKIQVITDSDIQPIVIIPVYALTIQ